VLLAALGAPSARGASDPVSCLAGNRGPCRQPAAVGILEASGTKDLLLVANFGILAAAGGGAWQFVCEENYGLAQPDRLRVDGRGRVLAASNQGLFVSDDLCAWSRTGGEIGSKALFDVDVDPRDPRRIWALGVAPRAAYLSSDGGMSFTERTTFADVQYMTRIRVAPSDPNTVYAVGFGDGSSTTFLATTTDGGATWSTRSISEGLDPPLLEPMLFLGIDPRDARVLYFVAVDADGDQLWRTTDGGRTLARVLALEEGAALVGFAFGAGSTIYVAGRDFLAGSGSPPGRLYISRDDGGSWEPSVPSGADGPRYACLAYDAGTLYACAAGEPGGDRFLLGASPDEGRTWQPVVRLQQVTGARKCVRSVCAVTEAWLCEAYGRCPDGDRDAGPAPTDAREAVDAGDDSCRGGRCTVKEQGCACVVGGAEPPSRLTLLALAVAGVIVPRRRRARVSRRRATCAPSETTREQSNSSHV
jgi:MYXO-CTERM domain-containing protein